MSYQVKFIGDCLAVVGLLFMLSAAHFYQQTKLSGKKLTFKEVVNHTYSELLHSTSTLFLTTGKNLAALEHSTSPSITKVSTTPHTNHTHKKEIQALNKQINFIKEAVSTDTMLALPEKNILTELVKECETKLDHLSHFIKKSLIEHASPDQINNEQSMKLFESYVTKKITALSENVLQLTLLFYKTMSGTEYPAPDHSSTTEILITLRNVNDKIKSFIA